MLVLNDEQFMEGIAGGIGWIIAVFYIRKQYLSKKGKQQSNIALVGAITWSILWVIRKILMNVYKHYKKIRNIKDKSIELPFSNSLHIFSFILINLLVLYIFVFKNSPSNNIIQRLSLRDLPLILFVLILGLSLYKY